MPPPKSLPALRWVQQPSLKTWSWRKHRKNSQLPRQEFFRDGIGMGFFHTNPWGQWHEKPIEAPIWFLNIPRGHFLKLTRKNRGNFQCSDFPFDMLIIICKLCKWNYLDIFSPSQNRFYRFFTIKQIRQQIPPLDQVLLPATQEANLPGLVMCHPCDSLKIQDFQGCP